MPAIAPTQARLRRSSRGSSCRPRSNHSCTRAHSNATSSARALRCPRGPVGNPARRHPPPAGRPGRCWRSSRTSRRMLVSWSATPRSSANSTARGSVVPNTASESRPMDPATKPAVDHQVVEGGVGGPADVHLASVDQLVEGAHGQLVLLARRPPRPPARGPRFQTVIGWRLLTNPGQFEQLLRRGPPCRRRCHRCAGPGRTPRRGRGARGPASSRMPYPKFLASRRVISSQAR